MLRILSIMLERLLNSNSIEITGDEIFLLIAITTVQNAKYLGPNESLSINILSVLTDHIHIFFEHVFI